MTGGPGRSAGSVLLTARWVVGHAQGRHQLLDRGEVVFDGDRIVFVGFGYSGPCARRIDCGNALIGPGFIVPPSSPSRRSARRRRVRRAQSGDALANETAAPSHPGDDKHHRDNGLKWQNHNNSPRWTPLHASGEAHARGWQYWKQRSR